MEALKEQAEAILGRERIALHSLFQDLLTQAADANDWAGSRLRML